MREALTQLAARGIVAVSARRGWFVIAPSRDEAREAFEAWHVIGLGLTRSARPVDQPALRQLKGHLQRNKAAVTAGTDVGTRSLLLGDFTACTTLIAMRTGRRTTRRNGAKTMCRSLPRSSAATSPQPKR